MADKPINHPLYDLHAPTWRMALDVYEGTGGFLDEDRPYLIPHPREWLDHSIDITVEGKLIRRDVNPNPRLASPKLKMRRKLARYENIAEAIVGSVSGALFRSAPARTFREGATADKELPIQRWQQNVDGKDSSLNAAVADGWIGAAAFGHLIFLVEPSSTQADTAADQGLPVLRSYTPLDMPDWLTDENGKLTAVKLLEPEPRDNFDSKPDVNAYRTRVVNEEKWTLYDSKGSEIGSGEHKMGRLPIAILYGKRRPLTPLIGKSIMGDPVNYIDVYNLDSETRELLRNQTFGILNVPVGKDGNVEEEQAKIGAQSGTANVLFTTEQAAYLSPDGGNVTVYHEHKERLVRSIYRLAKAAWESDTRGVEAADSLRIKRDEKHQTLATYASECQRTDDELVELAYRAMYGAEGWEQAKKADAPVTRYPEEFTPSDIDEVVARILEALGIDLGPTATKHLKKGVVRQLLPGLTDKELSAIDAEIDAQNIQTAEEKQAAMLEQMKGRFGKPDDDGGDDGDEDPDGKPEVEDDEDPEKKKVA